jgi:hypothetical protein
MERSSLRIGLLSVLGAAALLWILAASSAARGDVEENFDVTTTSDLVALCGAAPDDASYIGAINFCRGFGVGAYHYYLALAASSPEARYVCFPDPPPSRDTVRAAFVAWAGAHPEEMGKAPVDSLFRYLAEAYPCSEAMRAGQ